MRMDQVEPNKQYNILKVNDEIDESYYNKLLSMGIGVGTTFYTVKSEFYGLINFFIDNKRICLRKHDVKFIEVGEVSE